MPKTIAKFKKMGYNEQESGEKWISVVKSGKFPLKSIGKEVRILFSGEYPHTIDAKGRVIMPVKFREALGESFVVTKGLDRNLLVFSQEEWQKFYDKLSTLPLASKSSRDFSRMFLAGAIECETDKQGRILITAPLRAYASLLKDVTVIGNGNKVEIWSTENWNEYIGAIDTDAMAESLCELGIMI